MFPITGRDEALYHLDARAANELIRQPEVRKRLARAAKECGERPCLVHWGALEWLDADLGGVLRGAGELARLFREWPRVEAKLDQTPHPWPVFTSGGPVGRPGIERTMTTENVLVALRSYALRPLAREELSLGVYPEYRNADHRPQSGHKHAQGDRAHGASYADELAAAEVNDHEGRSAKYAMTRRHVEKQRARLTALLADARLTA
jgi:hypothetical protein